MQVYELRKILSQGPYKCVDAELQPATLPHEPDLYVCRFDVNGVEVGVAQAVKAPRERIGSMRVSTKNDPQPSLEEIAATVRHRLAKFMREEGLGENRETGEE